ncbi:MAG: WecB/TagA/CpsF family glycosyltransferase, partial [Candidatus Woesebacteria bacterium]|nr:WecB/TagA/CpsF family glycosyltransferase [Candidatus Woesebacteria bacterium]
MTIKSKKNDKKQIKMPRNYIKVDRKEGYILGIKISITSKEEVLNFVNSRLENKEKFYIVTPNPENLLLATKDWLLAKAIRRSDLSIPDGIGLAQAFKFLGYKDDKGNILRPLIIFFQGLLVGAATIVNKKYLTNDLLITKGRELFFDIMKIADERKLRVYLFGGENGEQTKSKEILEQKYNNVVFKTHHQFPQYSKNCQPATVSDRKMHKSIVGGIKLFEPDLIFVAMNTPKQEKWIYRNFFRLTNVTGAMTVGGTFNYIAGNMK